MAMFPIFVFKYKGFCICKNWIWYTKYGNYGFIYLRKDN